MADREPEERQQIIDLVKSVDSFNNISDLFHDDDVDEALATVVLLIERAGKMAPHDAATTIVYLSAVNVKLKAIARDIMTINKGGGSEANARKNVALSLEDSISKLVDALKYLARS